MTAAGRLARFVVDRSWDDLSERARQDLKIRVLDALGCALGALGAPPVAAVRAQVDELGGHPLSTLIGGGATGPDRAALYNGALVRYLDFNDSYFAPGETCHPSDNLAPVLAAAEYADASGRELLAALAVAYQVQCRLSDEAPVRAKGFDHTTQGSYAAAAGAAKALRLDERETASAVAIAGTALNALRVTRTGALSHWKGLAYPFTASGAVEAALLAARGITGPAEVFEGNKGFMDSIAGRSRSTGTPKTSILEYVLTQRGDAVARCLAECRELGFDIVEISSGFVTLPADDLVRLTKSVHAAGLKPKPEVGIQFGAGGASTLEALEAEGTRDVGQAIELAKRHLDAGAQMIMIESEGITEQVREWRTDVVARVVSGLGLENVMFEAADPDVFTWYVKNYGIDVNLFVDHSQIVQLECLRAGIWGTDDTWGRVLTYGRSSAEEERSWT
jgi:phosphosulfolactate synthase (CoM biosynthesis protein A)